MDCWKNNKFEQNMQLKDIKYVNIGENNMCYIFKSNNKTVCWDFYNTTKDNYNYKIKISEGLRQIN